MIAPRIFRHEVPVDGNPHHFDLTGAVVSVGCRKIDAVEFWYVADPKVEPAKCAFVVVGTGHPLPPSGLYVGTAVAPGGQLVWHLIEVEP